MFPLTRGVLWDYQVAFSLSLCHFTVFVNFYCYFFLSFKMSHCQLATEVFLFQIDPLVKTQQDKRVFMSMYFVMYHILLRPCSDLLRCFWSQCSDLAPILLQHLQRFQSLCHCHHDALTLLRCFQSHHHNTTIPDIHSFKFCYAPSAP